MAKSCAQEGGCAVMASLAGRRGRDMGCGFGFYSCVLAAMATRTSCRNAGVIKGCPQKGGSVGMACFTCRRSRNMIRRLARCSRAIMAIRAVALYPGVIKFCPQKTGGVFMADFTVIRSNNMTRWFTRYRTVAGIVTRLAWLGYTSMIHDRRLEAGRADMASFAGSGCLNMI